jgi:hypothetical protein
MLYLSLYEIRFSPNPLVMLFGFTYLIYPDLPMVHANDNDDDNDEDFKSFLIPDKIMCKMKKEQENPIYRF